MKIEYNNLYIHYVLNTLGSVPLIPEKNRKRIEKYITGIVDKHDCKIYAVYANPDHLHFLASCSPKISVEELASVVADSSADFINKNKLCDTHFAWQQSAAAFSVSKSGVDRVCKYILNQKVHHKKISVTQEYNSFMNHYLKKINRE
jgi:putative transposase